MDKTLPDAGPARRPRRRRSLGAAVLCAALLGNLLDEGRLLLDAVARRDRQAVFGSASAVERLVEHLAGMRDSALAMPAEERATMPDIDWQAWENLSLHVAGPPRERWERVWRAVAELVPATVAAAHGYQAPPDEGPPSA